ncbi:MAG: energy transducer TonB [Vulcanimicrobiaceae bacterium]
MRRATALATIAAFALATGAAAEAQQIGQGIAATIDELGMPESVESLDTGHTWLWRTPHAELRLITDDKAVLKAIDEHPLDASDVLSVEMQGKTERIPLFGYTIARADAQLGTAEHSGANFRTYDLGGGAVLDLLFDDSGKLTHAVHGQRGYVARLGLVPADRDMVRMLQYAAPKMRGVRLAATGASHETIVRCDVGKDGRVESVGVLVSSHDASADAHALMLARKTRWIPARLDSFPVKSVVFRIIAS